MLMNNLIYNINIYEIYVTIILYIFYYKVYELTEYIILIDFKIQ